MKDIEREKKVALIKELQEAKKSASKQQTSFDPTRTVDVGLLNEMSLADLRERLKMVQQEKEVGKNSDRNLERKKGEFFILD